MPTRTRPPPTAGGRRPVWVVTLQLAVLALAVFYGVSVIPGVRPTPGFSPVLDGWVTCLCFLGVVALLVVRAVRVEADRIAWLFFAAGLLCYSVGSIGYYVYYQQLPTVPYPSWSDVAWIAFYPLAYVALFLMLRARILQLNPSMWLDGIITGLTAAAFAVTFALGPALRITDGTVAAVVTNFAYPVADVVLFILVFGAIVVMGSGAGPAWWWVSAGLATFAVVDTVYAFQVASDSYVDGAWLDAGWVLAMVCFAAGAAREPGNDRRGTVVRTTVCKRSRLAGGGLLAVPGLCALAALGLLFYGYVSQVDDLVAGVLALGAVLAALVRATLTFREVQAAAESRRLARTDDLTALPNRRHFYDVLGNAVSNSLTREEPQTGAGVAVLILDLDHFKDINDSLGHHVGDELLRQIGPRLSSQLREGDLLARLGGDEFGVVLPRTPSAAAEEVAVRILTSLQEPFSLEVQPHGDTVEHAIPQGLSLVRPTAMHVDASVGIAVCPQHGDSVASLLQAADIAMYRAKTNRTGHAMAADVMDESGRQRLVTVEELHDAVASDQMVLHFQPKVHLHTGQVASVEALVRWQHQSRGLLYPDAFLPLVEQYGLMRQLTSTVLIAALEQADRWRRSGHNLAVAVNLSATNLLDPDFPQQVADLLHSMGLPASVLEFEITETVLMTDPKRARHALRLLRDLGVRLAVDDYGTGYSSLAYLHDLPVDELKLDRSFVMRSDVDARSAAIVTSTIGLAHALGLGIVAEGVETAEVLARLVRDNCDTAQGYYFALPQSAQELTRWLELRSASEVPA